MAAVALATSPASRLRTGTTTSSSTVVSEHRRRTGTLTTGPRMSTREKPTPHPPQHHRHLSPSSTDANSNTHLPPDLHLHLAQHVEHPPAETENWDDYFEERHSPRKTRHDEQHGSKHQQQREGRTKKNKQDGDGQVALGSGRAFESGGAPGAKTPGSELEFSSADGHGHGHEQQKKQPPVPATHAKGAALLSRIRSVKNWGRGMRRREGSTAPEVVVDEKDTMVASRRDQSSPMGSGGAGIAVVHDGRSCLAGRERTSMTWRPEDALGVEDEQNALEYHVVVEASGVCSPSEVHVWGVKTSWH
ncbi:unnamed protein product [Cyclocybe aegerita]|uniref:Uncharacterized protein n=1 Tax=Cyclocybe aegerita TaxID=1973307 RepID=A0A8S0XJ74_CYCAE|nr:unnamed protein product [Cyclocybe aegerita]